LINAIGEKRNRVVSELHRLEDVEELHLQTARIIMHFARQQGNKLA